VRFRLKIANRVDIHITMVELEHGAFSSRRTKTGSFQMGSEQQQQQQQQ
jgi:hypothetical protein